MKMLLIAVSVCFFLVGVAGVQGDTTLADDGELRLDPAGRVEGDRYANSFGRRLGNTAAFFLDQRKFLDNLPLYGYLLTEVKGDCGELVKYDPEYELGERIAIIKGDSSKEKFVGDKFVREGGLSTITIRNLCKKLADESPTLAEKGSITQEPCNDKFSWFASLFSGSFPGLENKECQRPNFWYVGRNERRPEDVKRPLAENGGIAQEPSNDESSRFASLFLAPENDEYQEMNFWYVGRNERRLENAGRLFVEKGGVQWVLTEEPLPSGKVELWIERAAFR